MARILIVYSSLFGANATLAGLAASALGATGAEVRVRCVREVALPGDVQPAADGAKVASGEYASESEVIRDGLRALQARERAMETWLRGEVAAAYDSMKADPSRARSLDDVKASLSAERSRVAKGR